MTTVFHTWPYGRFIEIQSNLRRKKLPRTNQGSNFLGGSLSNIDHARAPAQFRGESQSFSSTEINKPLTAQVLCLVCQIQVQKPILVVATESTIIGIDSNTSENIIRKVIKV